MTLSIPGTSAVVTPGANTQPFKAIGIARSQQNTNTQTNINNDTNTQPLTITVSDSNGGGPTDAAGTFVPAPGLRQIAPGTYTLDIGPTGHATTIANSLQNLAFTASQAPGAPNITVTAASSNQTVTQVIAAEPAMKFLVADTLANTSDAIQGTAYTGSAGVNNQYVVQIDNPALSAANLDITALAPGVFIHTGSGVDAISVAGVGGKNILDGGTNSNFLTGTLAGKGTDTFFVDARNAAADIWDTVANFHAGDAVTLFGITPTSKAIAWVDNQGTGSATGLTLHAAQAGTPTASFTLAGYTTADLSNGRLGTVYGAEPDGTPYLYVTGLK